MQFEGLSRAMWQVEVHALWWLALRWHLPSPHLCTAPLSLQLSLCMGAESSPWVLSDAFTYLGLFLSGASHLPDFPRWCL